MAYQITEKLAERDRVLYILLLYVIFVNFIIKEKINTIKIIYLKHTQLY